MNSLKVSDSAQKSVRAVADRKHGGQSPVYLTASRGRAVGSFVEFVKSFGSDSKNVCPRAECTERKACASPPPEAKLAVVAAPYRTAPL